MLTHDLLRTILRILNEVLIKIKRVNKKKIIKIKLIKLFLSTDIL